ncbi:MAG: DEAD/DEAH box helicase [Gordonibacter pamelaeae]|uniref:DEAD/DEAH box helicase n=1 Tax=Gordonibacter pamelaeae TaxID=471189 RepID=UPI002432DE51|nr:DEAD/DEAH box helicase [Gordonibacter pamelaeae]MBS4895448.1 DEAD/DEAH box helicase [Gordonibacter pamelaeae]
MKAVLHPYQETAAGWLRERPEAALLLDMGLGKTLIALTALVDLATVGEDVWPALVIAPLMTARHVWPAEVAKWDHTRHLRASLVLGSASEREAALRRPAEIYVVNRENVQWLTDRYGPRWPFRTVIVDELSSFKNHQAKRWKALRRVRPMIRRVWGLTGTPAPNGLMDLWAQMHLVDRGERLGRYIGPYRERYFSPGRRSGHVVYDWAPKPGAEDAIFRAIGDVALSMRAKDELELPGRVDNVVEVEMPPAAMAEYRRFERDQATELLGEEVTAASAAALANKLLQWADGAVYDDGGEAQEVHRAKLDALAGIIEEAQGQPVLVFYAFRHDLDRLRAAYPASKALGAHSGDLVERWNRGEVPLLLAHPQQAGHGLNLQDGGHIAVWFGLTWSLEAYLQANARLDRQGQKETTIVHHLVAKGTVDERVMDVLAGKRTLQDAMMDALRGGERGE